MPTHAYIGRAECGCCIYVIADTTEDKEQIGSDVGKAIASGLNVTRVTWDEYLRITEEPHFMKCDCEQ